MHYGVYVQVAYTAHRVEYKEDVSE